MPTAKKTVPARKRTAKRVTAKAAPARRQYQAARRDRLVHDWVYSHMAADKEIRLGLEIIRARARSLERDNDYARRYLSLVEANIVGKSGFSLRLAVPDKLAEKAALVKAEFKEWLDVADVSGVLDGASLQRLVARTTARDGEALALFIRKRTANKYGLGVQLLESDYLPLTTAGVGGDKPMGMELDEYGRPTVYHLHAKHPGGDSTMPELRKIPASDVIHVYRPERPGQTRAVSWMASVMLPLKMLGGYQEAELVAARMAACQMGFYKVSPGANPFEGDGIDEVGQPVTDAAPGMFERLPVGYEFQAYNPTHPTTQYGEFVKSILREIASGLNVSYSALANDGSDANYSSMREMSILERENWMVLQHWFARALMRRLFDEWLTAAELVEVFEFDLEPFRGTDRWTGKTWPWVDPAKDAKAREADVAMRLTAPSLLAEEKGLDFAEVCKIAARDEAFRAKENADARARLGLAPEVSNEPKD
jgi:lambda family phage portal protein